MPPPHIPKKAPNPYNLRLVKVLSGNDGIGGGIGNIKHFEGTDGRDIKGRLVVLADGGLIVADPVEKRLKMFDKRGMFVRSFVCRKNNYDAPLSPDIITVDAKNRLIVADEHRGQVFILDMTGRFILDFKLEKGESDYIMDIYVTSQDNIIVVTNEYRGHDLFVFSPAGACLGKTELSGDRWFFSNDRVLSDGNLYDFTNVDPGKHQTIVRKDMTDTIGGTTSGFVMDDKGNMYVRHQTYIVLYDASGKETELPVGGHIGYDGGYMLMLDDGHVAVSQGNVTSIWDGKRIHRFDGVLLVAVGRTAIVCRIQCAGNRCHAAFVKIAAPDTEQELFKIPTSGVVPVATDAANRIILGDHGCVRILNPNYNVERTITGAGKNGVALKSITAVAADHKNNIFAVDYWNDRYSYTKFVHMFDANGAFLKSDLDDEIRGNVPGHMADVLESYPKTARDSHGRTISVNWKSITIRDSSGNDVKEISVGGAYGERIEFADALTVDKWDRIIAVEKYLLTIRIFDHDGNLVRTARGTSMGGKKLKEIHGVAADGMGRIIISGRDENGVILVQVFGAIRKPVKTPRSPRNVGRDDDPLRILQVRYAKGELTDEQFESMKKKLA